jgi:uncharacterized membrane protein
MNGLNYSKQISLAIGIWCTALVAPPFLRLSGLPFLATMVEHFFSGICHQMDSHSLHLFGYKLGVCTRCTFIYVGFLAGSLLLPHVNLKFSLQGKTWLAIAAAPMIIDVALNSFGIHQSNELTRILTGGFFGIVSSFVLLPTLDEALSELFKFKNWTVTQS